jgi:1D-myo-inositol 3-kinase
VRSQFKLVGHFTHDRCGESIHIGGSAYFGASICRWLGDAVEVVTSVADDFRFFDSIQWLRPSVEPAHETTTFENCYMPDGQRTQRVFGCASRLVPRRESRSTRPFDVLHLAPVMGEVDLGLWKRGCPARILAISLQGWLRTTRGDRENPAGRAVMRRDWRPQPGELSGVDVVFVSDEDLAGDDSLLVDVCKAVPIVVRTSGADGAEVIKRGECWRIGVYPTVAVDPTGAGDAFAAGFLHAFASGQSLEAAGRLGSAVASIVVEATGALALKRVPEAFGRVDSIQASRAISPV